MPYVFAAGRLAAPSLYVNYASNQAAQYCSLYMMGSAHACCSVSSIQPITHSLAADLSC